MSLCLCAIKWPKKRELGWKLFYSLVSLVGIVLIVKGYADLRQTPTVLYATPLWMRHVAATILLPVFVLFLVPYFPGRIKNVIKHPQLLAVAHLLVNGTMADVIVIVAGLGLYLVMAFWLHEVLFGVRAFV